MRTIAFVSEKGGVGKSSSIINLAAALAAKGLRVLAIDTDPQGNASYVLLGGQKPRHPTLHEVLIGQADADAATVPTVLDGVSLIPADATLADANVTLAGEVGRERRLRLAMEQGGEEYDYVLVDTAPTRSLLTTNVLNYVGELFVPIVPSLFGILGLGQLQNDISTVRRFLDNKVLRIGGIFLTMLEKNNVARDTEEQLRQVFGKLVFKTKIPRNIRIEEAHSRHESVLTYAPKSVGATAYQALAMEILSNGREENGDGDSGRDSSVDHAAA